MAYMSPMTDTRAFARAVLRRLAGIAALAVLALALGTAAAWAKGAHDYSFTAIDGTPLPLDAFAGRPVLVVNTASFCGFTYQYEGLQALYDAYRGRGLVVLGVPSPDFNQEYASAGEVKEFCDVTYGIDFPMTDLVHVRGAQAHPFYQWVAATGGNRAVPRWNFHKLLLGGDGALVAAWPSTTKPRSRAVVARVEALLPR